MSQISMISMIITKWVWGWLVHLALAILLYILDILYILIILIILIVVISMAYSYYGYTNLL